MKLIDDLINQGYIVSVDKDEIVIKYPGKEKPDLALLKELKAHKQEAIAYLRNKETLATLWQAVADELGTLWQRGTRQYIEQHRPELAAEIDGAEARANKAWLDCEDGAGDLATFKKALAEWRQANIKAIRAYDDTKPLTVGAADPAEVARAREHLKRKGYFLMESLTLGVQVAVVEREADRGRAPQGVPTYTIEEIHLLALGVRAGNIISIGICGCCTQPKQNWAG